MHGNCALTLSGHHLGLYITDTTPEVIQRNDSDRGKTSIDEAEGGVQHAMTTTHRLPHPLTVQILLAQDSCVFECNIADELVLE